MAETRKPKATLLTPGEEYDGYVKFCEKEGLKASSKADFFEGAYYLAVRKCVAGPDVKDIAAYDFADATLLLCEVDNKGLALALFKTADLVEMEAAAAEQVDTPPADHIE